MLYLPHMKNLGKKKDPTDKLKLPSAVIFDIDTFTTSR